MKNTLAKEDKHEIRYASEHELWQKKHEQLENTLRKVKPQQLKEFFAKRAKLKPIIGPETALDNL